MNRQQLAHLLRAAAKITNDPDVVVIGSQAVLGEFDEDELPGLATASIEADLLFFDDGDSEKWNGVDGAIGEGSEFHQMNGYYAQGVDVNTASLPEGWQGRLVGWNLASSDPSQPLFLEAHDLAVSKLVAGRDKDYEFVDALIRAGLLKTQKLRLRTNRLAVEEGVRVRVLGWINDWH